MMEYKVTRAAPDELKHWGIKGQKWGVRRFENADGTLTEEGKKRYGRSIDEVKKNLDDAQAEAKRKRLRSDDLNSRWGLKAFTTNDIKNARAARAAVKAEKKAAEFEEVYNRLVEHEKQRKEENKRSFENSKKEIGKKGMMSWFQEVRGTKDEDSFFEHIWETKSDLLDSWWTERYKTNSDKEWDSLQKKYCNKLIRELGLPNTRETYSFIADWFINGDD